MKIITVNGNVGITTSVIPHRNGKYPVWFLGGDNVQFIDSEKVTFT